MTWQEELRQLDSALAGGELSANEYRKRRDEILAAASSAQPPSPVIGAPPGPRPEGEAAEVTQVVNVDSVDNVAETELVNEADKTQIISDPAKTAANAEPERQAVNQANQPGPAERTQVIATDERTQPAVQQPHWATQLPDPNAPTGVFPRQQPIGPGPAVTPMDAQDLFTSNKPPRNSGKKPWLIAVAVVVVLALAGGAVWFFGFRDDGGQDPADRSNEQSTPAAPPDVDITKIELPGEAAPDAGEMDIVRAGELKVIAPAEATLLADAGADAMVYSGSSEGDYRFLLYSYESKDAAAAKELTEKITGVQKQLGFQDTEVQGVPGEVAVSAVENEAAGAVRGVYTYGNTTIQLCVLQIPKGNVDDLRVQFQNALTAVTDAAPPTR